MKKGLNMMLHMAKCLFGNSNSLKVLPFSHLTSPSVIDSANGGTFTIFTSAPELEKRDIRTGLVTKQ